MRGKIAVIMVCLFALSCISACGPKKAESSGAAIDAAKAIENMQEKASYLIGQAIGRLGNYINQELYGPPTTLPWGLSIEPAHRIPPWNDLEQYPVETTRFHPTFAYEMIWNLFFAGVLTYLIVKKEELMRPGVVAGSVLLITGVGRALLEINFRPDQPEFFGLGVSTSLIVSIIFALIGLFIVLAKSGMVSISFMESTTEYKKRVVHRRRPPTPRKARQKKA